MIEIETAPLALAISGIGRGALDSGGESALDIDPAWHVRMQAACQRHVDNGVSKTINLPTSASAAHIRDAYRLAWTLGCKGITVYRQGTRPGQVLGPAQAEMSQCPECAAPLPASR